MIDRMIQLNREHRKAKPIAVLLCVLIVSIILLSTIFVVSEADHECSDDCCPICVLINQCNAVLRSAGEGAAALTIAALLVLVISELSIATSKNTFLTTLITQNVRMNN